MTFIVRKPKTDGSKDIVYDVVAEAELAEVDSGGHLILSNTGHQGRVLAIYGPGQWFASFEAGQVRQGREDKIYDALTAEAIISPQN